MPTDDELRAENARLRDELKAARQPPQAGTVDPGVVQGEQRATETWQHWDATVKRLNKEAADLWADGRFEEAQTKQSEMATAALHRESAAQAYGQWNQLRGAPVVEQYLAARPGQYTREEQSWIRRHPSYATDPAFQARIAAEYNAAQTEGFRPGSAALVARMDRVAADLGVVADHGPAPMLSGTLLATARSSFDAIHPERGGVSSPEEVSRWWHEMRHSPAAARIRENWLVAEDDKSRW
jgi:hypothetical protein